MALPSLAGARGCSYTRFAGQYLRQDPDAAGVQVLTKACIWGNNLYNAGKGKVLEQACTVAPVHTQNSTHAKPTPMPINAFC